MSMKLPPQIALWDFLYERMLVGDGGDGAWIWTSKGKQEIPAIVRTYLGSKMYDPKAFNERFERNMIFEVFPELSTII